MPKYLSIIMFVIVGCVNQKEKEHSNDSVLAIETTYTENPKTLFDTSISINGQQVHLVLREINEDESILYNTVNGKTSMIDTFLQNTISDFTLLPFDNDEIPDLYISYLGNNLIEELYQLDTSNYQFRKIKGFIEFPNANQIKGTRNIFYSYHRAGCADYNWVSDLFKIENFKAIHLGHIEAKECEGSDKTIEFFHVYNNSDSMILFRKISIDSSDEYNGDKWEFLNQYWNTNHRLYK